MDGQIEVILDYWFGTLDDDGMSAPEHHQRWFGGGPEVDAYCREQFGLLVAGAVVGELDHWMRSDDGLVALVLLLDQFTRNIHRDSPQAFCGDARALTLVQRAVSEQRNLTLPLIHQVFLLMPYEHSEQLSVQKAGLALFDTLVERANRPEIERFRDYALAHCEVIERFGRFPHRNSILGRASTAAELEYLVVHGGF